MITRCAGFLVGVPVGSPLAGVLAAGGGVAAVMDTIWIIGERLAVRW
jgi:hypothetical protein